jgi:hypothetical protein
MARSAVCSSNLAPHGSSAMTSAATESLMLVVHGQGHLKGVRSAKPLEAPVRSRSSSGSGYRRIWGGAQAQATGIARFRRLHPHFRQLICTRCPAVSFPSLIKANLESCRTANGEPPGPGRQRQTTLGAHLPHGCPRPLLVLHVQAVRPGAPLKPLRKLSRGFCKRCVLSRLMLYTSAPLDA